MQFRDFFYINTAFLSVKNSFVTVCKFDLSTNSKYLNIHVTRKRAVLNLSIVFREGSRTEAKSKMERFVLKINGWKPLTIVKKVST